MVKTNTFSRFVRYGVVMFTSVLLLLLFGSESEFMARTSHPCINAGSIAWTDFETAVENNKNDPRPFFIDMYTDWCGWCSKMDISTFSDPAVIEFISENFHAVKFNPEKEESIAYKGKVYEKKDYPQFKRSYNELGVSLMGSNMSFPTFVILSKKEVRMGAIAGFQVAEVLIAKTKAIAKI